MSRITRLGLSHFRTYQALDVALAASMIALVGENGAGKTNVLEALSYLTPGRGLRRAAIDEPTRRIDGRETGADAAGWAVSVEIETGHRLGTGLERGPDGLRRAQRIDRHPVSSAAAFAEHLRIVWLTPEQDGLFRGAAGDRRRFLDRMVLTVDAGHGARMSAFERALRSRNRLLEAFAPDARWLDALEHEIAGLGVAAAAARRETIDRLSALIVAQSDPDSPFPDATLAIDGAIEGWLLTEAASVCEDRYRDLLRAGRERDTQAGRALAGPQTSDLAVRHRPKDIAACDASTGEQKALLIGLALAQARLVAQMSGLAPVLLMDEVAAHLDPRRRAALYERLDALDAQVWLTGADPLLFVDLPVDAQRLRVTPGRLEPH